MHITGKILLVLAIVGAGVAAAFTAKMVQVRGSWMQENETLRQANIANAEKIAAGEKELEQLRDELQVTLMNWGTPITGFNIAAVSPTSINMQIGTRHGMITGQDRQLPGGTPGENPMLHAFRPRQDGQGHIWVGPLRVQTVTETNTEAVPVWTVRPGEAAPWQQFNQNWRVWQRVPPGAVTRFTDLQLRLIDADRVLTTKTNYLASQQARLEGAKQQNQIRRMELLGPENPPAAPESLQGMEYTHGLLSAIAAEEEARNDLLAAIDKLRRDLKQSYAALERTQQENLERVRQLPQPPAESITSR